jgi:hypothetical protein
MKLLWLGLLKVRLSSDSDWIAYISAKPSMPLPEA